MTKDEKLQVIIQDVWDRDVKSVPDAIIEVKALFNQGHCVDCFYYKSCAMPELFIGDGSRSYCSDFVTEANFVHSIKTKETT